jgi:ubiquinone/menaquinone biosynthesis C-methylase UbiE
MADKDEIMRYLRVKRVDLELTPIKPHDVVLDVGCGFGQDCVLFSKWGCFAVGVDISKDFLRIKKLLKDLATLNFVRASAFKLPFRDGSFDVVVSYSAIEHTSKNYLEWVKEMKRVTKKLGYVIITTSNRLLNVLLVILSKIKNIYMHKKYKQRHLERFFSPKEFRQMIDAMGLKMIKCNSCGLYYHSYPLTPFVKINKCAEDIAFVVEQKLRALRHLGGRMGFLCLNI